MSANRIVSRTFAMLSAREAIESVAALHPDACVCLTCRAANGDERSFREIVQAVGDLAQAADADRGSE